MTTSLLTNLSRWVGAPALLMSCALFASACAGPSYPNCTQDENCKDKGEFCLNNKCAQCRVDANCAGASGDACVTCMAGACGRKADCCTTKLDCGAGKMCTANKCVVDPNAAAAARGVSKGCASDADCGDGLRCEAGLCLNSKGQCEVVPVRFAFNETALSDSAQNALIADERCMKLRKISKLTIAGNCDERGTDAYNMELGSRRAKAVKQYLTALDGKFKLKTISYGKSRPLCTAENDSCFAENRRADMSLANQQH